MLCYNDRLRSCHGIIYVTKENIFINIFKECLIQLEFKIMMKKLYNRHKNVLFFNKIFPFSPYCIFKAYSHITSQHWFSYNHQLSNIGLFQYLDR